jgi:ribonucleoside-diphosphate reductase beta chain
MPHYSEFVSDAVENIPVTVNEPLLEENPDRFVLFPIQHHDIWAMYKKQLSVIWFAEEIDLKDDKAHFDRLSEGEQHFIKHVLGFFAGSDGIVMENLATRFMREVQWPEAKCYYTAQNQIEAIHAESYALLIDTYITDREEKKFILQSIQNFPAVKHKADWALQWIENKDVSFATRLLAFAAVEGIFFSGSFCAIFWLKKRGLMPGLCVSNELISRDEGLHTDAACLLYSKLNHKLTATQALTIVENAVAIEKEFVTEALPVRLIGMNADLMCQYIEFVADRLLVQLGYEKRWNSANPFDFMERISLESKDNFFEKRVTTYAKASVGKDMSKMVFSIEEDF